MALWTFLSTWNEFPLALLFLNDPSVQPVSLVPLRFQQQYFIDVPKIFAALVLSQLSGRSAVHRHAEAVQPRSARGVGK